MTLAVMTRASLGHTGHALARFAEAPSIRGELVGARRVT